MFDYLSIGFVWQFNFYAMKNLEIFVKFFIHFENDAPPNH